ncbi:hypothetical protein BDQ17DRAFT_1361403 [Cyathus striatus]|nr:hypothetical protein BDQ17DRAFT_1361403 [Cyathus striatus]
MYSPLYKPGEIRKGTTCVKLSTVRDPGRCKPSADAFNEIEEDELDNSSSKEDVEREEEEDIESTPDDEWYWADEEELTLQHAWPQGLSTERGIIYHHSNTAQIHITLNTTELPRRKGISNVPYVFRARGRIRLTPIPSPNPSFPCSAPVQRPPCSARKSCFSLLPRARNARCRVRLFARQATARFFVDRHDSDADAEGETDPEVEDDKENVEFGHSHPYFAALNSSPPSSNPSPIKVEEEQEFNPPSSPYYSADLDIDRWNEKGEFEKYLARYTGPFVSSYPASPVSSPSGGGWDVKPTKPSTQLTASQVTRKSSSRTPGLTQCSSIPSSPFSSPQQMPPPPPPTSSPLPNGSTYASSPYNPLPYHFLSSHSFPKFTPAPPKANRERIKRVIMRIDKWKKGEWMCAKDEAEEVEEEVDEVEEEEEPQKRVEDMTEEEVEALACKLGKPPGVSVNDWDCFGDEIEV